MPTNATVVKMRLAKVTKGALMYQEVNADGADVTTDEEGVVLRTMYVRKAKLAGEPQRIEVSIKVL